MHMKFANLATIHNFKKKSSYHMIFLISIPLITGNLAYTLLLSEATEGSHPGNSGDQHCQDFSRYVGTQTSQLVNQLHTLACNPQISALWEYTTLFIPVQRELTF